MVSQIIIMREFLTVFYGNEISVGFMLAGWLLWGAFGSAVLGKFSDRIKERITFFSLSQILLAVFIPLKIVEIRLIKILLNKLPGEVIGFFPMLLGGFIIAAPICALLGFMFSLGCRIYDSEKNEPASGIAGVYILEAIGAMIGGVIVSFILIKIIPSFYIAVGLGTLNVIAAMVLAKYNLKTYTGKIFRIIILLFFISEIIFCISGGFKNINRSTLKAEWKGYELVDSTNSIYGNIALTKKEEQHSFFNNGLHLYTIPDKKRAEESVHFALLTHPTPRKVLLLGGGLGGLLDEILKYKDMSVDYVELDNTILDMANKYLSQEETASLHDQRVNIINSDGRFFVKNTKKKYDVIILNIGNPYTAKLNRFYTVQFFEEAKNALKEEGILSFSLDSSESYMSREERKFLSSVYLSLAKVFADVKIIPGDTAYFLACPDKNILTYDPKIFERRVKERGLNVLYVRDYYLVTRLSKDNISYAENAIKMEKNTRINYDFKPISYYYDMVLWASRMGNSFIKNVFEKVGYRLIRIYMMISCFLLILYGILNRRSNNLYNNVVIISLFTTGFAEMAFQIVILLSFQIIYGYMFYKLGFILTSFMIGLTLGSFIMAGHMGKIKNVRKAYIMIQGTVFIYPLILPLIFRWLSASTSGGISYIGSNAIFPLLPIIAGFIGGLQFPLANKIRLTKREMTGSVAGLSYGVDLLGACLGALLAGAFLVPVIGIPETCFWVAIINLTVFLLLIFSYKSCNKIDKM